MSNFIQVTEIYAIASTNRQWMVLKRKGDGTKKEGHHIEWNSQFPDGTLDQAVYQLGQLLLRTSGSKNSEELQAAAKEISTLLSQKFAQSSSIKIG